MKIILASPRGFCAGVNMAISSLELALERFGAPVYVYHEIVHNRRVVNTFRRCGAVFVDDLDDVPAGSVLLFSAHGVPPEIRRAADARHLTAIDATCPLVARVHSEAVRYSQAGYTVLLIGHAGHDEVVGTLGEAPEAIVLVETQQDVDRLDFPPRTRLACLTQTTLAIDDTRQMIRRLEERFPQMALPRAGGICLATQHRQRAVSLLCRVADLVLVLGSQNSSNSRRLQEIPLHHGVPAYLVDGAADLDPAWFEPHATVLVTAGASAPETTVRECVAFLQRRFGATVEERSVGTERGRFALPEGLREPASRA